ncbi:hypothetical protein PQR02_15480 [Paraburkholderia sediminicola]
MTHASLAVAPQRAALAPEARFRVQAANSSPRHVRVVTLSECADDELRACATASGSNVRFARANELAALAGTHAPQEGGWPHTMNAASDAMAAWLGAPDLAIMVGSEGDDPRAAVLAAQAWCQRGVTVSAVIRPAVQGAQAQQDQQQPRCYRTADALRPWCTMLVLASGNDYLADLLEALGATGAT